MSVSRFNLALLRRLLMALTLVCTCSWADDKDLMQVNPEGSTSSPANQLLSTPAAPAAPNLSPADAANVVRQKVEGQVMSVSAKRSAKGTIYGVKVLNSGRMRVILVDGQSGEILN